MSETMKDKLERERAAEYADSDRDEIEDARRVVRRALLDYARGRENAVSGSELAGRVSLKATTVRDLIADLRDDPEGPAIANCTSGYYVITTREELEEWVASVNEEIQTKRERIAANVESFTGGNNE
jgi:biotin operon repressor